MNQQKHSSINLNDVSRVPIGIMVLGLGLPTLVTWIYFDLLASFPSSIQQIAYAVGKSVQFLLPVLVWWKWPRRQLASVDLRSSIVAGMASGLLIAIAIGLLYLLVLLPSGMMEGPRSEARVKLTQMGINAPWLLVAIAIFYSMFHSGLEEYYWRWFVFRRLGDWIPFSAAVAVSSLGFMLHHVLVLSRFFGWDSPMTYVFSLCVATGGVIWSVLYHRYGTLVGPWLCHLFVDAALFYVAYQLAFGS